MVHQLDAAVEERDHRSDRFVGAVAVDHHDLVGVDPRHEVAQHAANDGLPLPHGDDHVRPTAQQLGRLVAGDVEVFAAGPVEVPQRGPFRSGDIAEHVEGLAVPMPIGATGDAGLEGFVRFNRGDLSDGGFVHDVS